MIASVLIFRMSGVVTADCTIGRCAGLPLRASGGMATAATMSHDHHGRERGDEHEREDDGERLGADAPRRATTGSCGRCRAGPATRASCRRRRPWTAGTTARSPTTSWRCASAILTAPTTRPDRRPRTGTSASAAGGTGRGTGRRRGASRRCCGCPASVRRCSGTIGLRSPPSRGISMPSPSWTGSGLGAVSSSGCSNEVSRGTRCSSGGGVLSLPMGSSDMLVPPLRWEARPGRFRQVARPGPGATVLVIPGLRPGGLRGAARRSRRARSCAVSSPARGST